MLRNRRLEETLENASLRLRTSESKGDTQIASSDDGTTSHIPSSESYLPGLPLVHLQVTEVMNLIEMRN